ncbi:MAG: hypothetical protein LBL79_06625 [Prevotella sp.]|nr:hypothetical protein [Prevotella sp.]
MSARFTVRPVAGSKAKRAELASSMLRQASRLTPFSPDGFPACKAYGAGLARIIVALRFRRSCHASA